jgi:sec-independent protein translocase protein TatA
MAAPGRGVDSAGGTSNGQETTMGLNGWEFVILIGVLLLLFGAKKLPDMARSVGQSARIFKGEMKGMKADDDTSTQPKPDTAAALPPSSTTTAEPAPRPAAEPAPRPASKPDRADAS